MHCCAGEVGVQIPGECAFLAVMLPEALTPQPKSTDSPASVNTSMCFQPHFPEHIGTNEAIISLFKQTVKLFS